MDMTMGETGGRGTRWVCPNDRHLALRAKLRTGWSVKTGSLDSGWNDYRNPYSTGGNHCGQSYVVSEEERQAIIQVIQRAEALDLSEQERVGRLVERLENMKRNVCIVTSTRLNERKSCGSRCSGGTRCVCSCALCGEKFGAVLGATPSLCKDCRKYMCQKCGIETIPSLMFPNISPNARGVSAATRPTEERTAMQRIVKRTGNAQKQFLCRICAETREMWKKSGAWFFKGMPKYILPEKKERGWSRASHKTSTWTIGGRSLESAEPQDSSSDEDTSRRLAVARGHSVSSTNLPGNQENAAARNLSPLSISAQASNSGSKTSPGRRSNGLSPLSSREECSDRLDRSTLSIVSQCSRLSPTSSVATFRSRTNGKNSNGAQVEQRVSFEDEVLADEKASKSEEVDEADNDVPRIEFNTVDRSKSCQVQSFRPNASSAVATPTTPTVPTEQFQQIQEQFRKHEKNVDREGSRSGSDQESLSSSTRGNSRMNPPRLQAPEYPHGSLLSVTNCQTKNNKFDPTLATNGTKFWDSRSLVAIRPSSSVPPVQSGTSARLKSNGHTRTRRSILQTQHTASGDSCDHETTSYKNCTQDAGSGVQRDAELLRDNGNRYMEWQSTTHPDPPGRSVGPRLPRRSEVSPARITTISDETLQRLAARPLPSGQRGGSMGRVLDRTGRDPKNATNNHRQQRVLDYSIARTAARKLVSRKIVGRNSQSTSVKWKTLNPEWNEEFAFATRLTDLMKLTLCITVWDKDFGKSNDYLGGLELSCNSKGARLRHWVDAIKFPDHRHRTWHNLTETVLPTD